MSILKITFSFPAKVGFSNQVPVSRSLSLTPSLSVFRTCLVLSFLVLSCHVLPCLVVSCRVVSCRVLPCLVVSCLTLFYLPGFVSSCHVVSRLVFSCLALHYNRSLFLSFLARLFIWI